MSAAPQLGLVQSVHWLQLMSHVAARHQTADMLWTREAARPYQRRASWATFRRSLHVVCNSVHVHQSVIERKFQPKFDLFPHLQGQVPWFDCIRFRNLKPLCRFVVFVRIIVNPLRHHICICHQD